MRQFTVKCDVCGKKIGINTTINTNNFDQKEIKIIYDVMHESIKVVCSCGSTAEFY